MFQRPALPCSSSLCLPGVVNSRIPLLCVCHILPERGWCFTGGLSNASVCYRSALFAALKASHCRWKWGQEKIDSPRAVTANNRTNQQLMQTNLGPAKQKHKWPGKESSAEARKRLHMASWKDTPSDGVDSAPCIAVCPLRGEAGQTHQGECPGALRGTDGSHSTFPLCAPSSGDENSSGNLGDKRHWLRPTLLWTAGKVLAELSSVYIIFCFLLGHLKFNVVPIPTGMATTQ